MTAPSVYRSDVVTAAVAGLSLVVGFGVAQLTGVRSLGGLVLLAAVAWCGVRWWQLSRPLAVGLVVSYVGGFVLSHVIADALGAWPAVLTIAASQALLAWISCRWVRRR